MANEKTPVVWDDDAKKHRPLGSGEKMGGLSASSMISSDSGNLLQQGSDGLMLVTGSSLADPRADNLLEESANGKLQVTSDRVVEWLEGHPQAAAAIAEAVKVVSGDDGNVITAGTDKGAFMSKNTLASAVSTMSAAQLTTLANALRKQGGGLSVGSDGKLSVDFGSMDPAIMRGVVLSMVQAGGGIAVDSSGKLYVDFDTMPTDKFEALLKSLKMQIPLEADKSFYVAKNDSNASDVIEDGRGTEAKPFKTVQACVNFASQNYAVGSHTIFIRVKPGTYAENLVLPTVTRTSGGIQIRAFDLNEPPVLTHATNDGKVISVSGTGWSLYRFSVAGSRVASNDGLSHYPGLVAISNTGSLTVGGVAFSDEFTGPATSSGYELLRLFTLQGGTLRFVANAAYTVSIHAEKGNANACEVLNLSSGATLVAYSTNDSSMLTDIECWGEFTVFAVVSDSSTLNLVGGALYVPAFVVPTGKTAIGKQYNVAKGGGISLSGGSTLPGDIAGTADSATYGWYVGG